MWALSFLLASSLEVFYQDLNYKITYQKDIVLTSSGLEISIPANDCSKEIVDEISSYVDSIGKSLYLTTTKAKHLKVIYNNKTFFVILNDANAFYQLPDLIKQKRIEFKLRCP